MSLVAEQWAFLQDVAKLIQFAASSGFTLTGGELYRTPEQQAIYQQKGTTTTANSFHLKRLAIDFNIFKDGKLISDWQEAKLLGEFWESLSPKNRWGGHWKTFKDAPHFERRA